MSSSARRPDAAPRRPASLWVAAACYVVADVLLLGGLLWSMWLAVAHFPEAGWLHRSIPTPFGDLRRIPIVVAVWLGAVLAGTAASITGYYAWCGHRWPRWAALVALLAGTLGLLGHPVAGAALIPLAAGAILLWLPSSRRFADAVAAVRQAPRAAEPEPSAVHYGPLRRYAADS